jgi:hypothetical protein
MRTFTNVAGPVCASMKKALSTYTAADLLDSTAGSLTSPDTHLLPAQYIMVKCRLCLDADPSLVRVARPITSLCIRSD